MGPGESLRLVAPSGIRGSLRTVSPERSLSFSAPTSPFLPRFNMRVPSTGGGLAACRRARADAHGFEAHEAVSPLLAAPLSQQVSPVRRRSIAVGARGSFSDANASNTLGDGTDSPDDGSSSSSSSSKSVGSFDGDIDGDSMALDDATDASVDRRMSVSTAPRNKAFERLRSLVEEDRQPLASEMEHEGHITRSIRHSSVQEWLRVSSSSSSPSLLASPPPPAPPADDSAGRAARPAGWRARADDLIPFPASPASSAVSSPRLPAAALGSGTAAPNGGGCGAASSSGASNGGTGGGGARLGKRKSIEDNDDRPNTYKRQAMSPSGLRAQIAFGKAKRAQPLAPARSGPSSPLLRPPMAPSANGVIPSFSPSRGRSRSGAALTLNTASLAVLQTNGVFSRMHIRDSATTAAENINNDDDSDDEHPRTAS
ncbi:hypothetical protein H4R19_002956 [Coemansia spiralis]|nr:hypothetical protein H4R19_002956 [Coemansia spiralis]